MNEVMNAILTRRSVRKFTDTPIPKEILEELVDAALHAPTGMGKQTWKFTVITNKEVLSRLINTVGAALGRTGYDMYNPTAIILPTNEKDSIWGREDNACATENIFLAAHSHGIGSVWINQMQNLNDNPAIRQILDEIGVPSDHVVYGLAVLGYPDPSFEPAPKKIIGKVAYVE